MNLSNSFVDRTHLTSTTYHKFHNVLHRKVFSPVIHNLPSVHFSGSYIWDRLDNYSRYVCTMDLYNGIIIFSVLFFFLFLVFLGRKCSTFIVDSCSPSLTGVCNMLRWHSELLCSNSSHLQIQLPQSPSVLKHNGHVHWQVFLDNGKLSFNG